MVCVAMPPQRKKADRAVMPPRTGNVSDLSREVRQYIYDYKGGLLLKLLNVASSRGSAVYMFLNQMPQAADKVAWDQLLPKFPQQAQVDTIEESTPTNVH